MAGKNLTLANDPLHPVTIQRVVEGIRNPDGQIAQQVKQLRSMKLMDENQYKRLKTQLPYIVAGKFSPAVRRKENFVHTDHFILDIDHLSKFGHGAEPLKALLKKDERIVLMFTSPGNDGLKLLFRLTKRVHDAGYFTLFYKQFAARFATGHGLAGLVDVRTNDASRCCFMSHDPELWHNEMAEAVEADDYLDMMDIASADRAEKEITKAVEEQKAQLETANVAAGGSKEPSAELLARIKARIDPNKIVRPKREVVQPAALEEVWERLTAYLREMGMPVEKITPISYGRQVRVRAGNLWAEVNIFSGKKGFSVVATTKTGSSPELAKLAQEGLSGFF